MLSIVIVIGSAGCEDDSAAYKRGKTEGAAEQKEQSYNEGYKSGYDVGYNEAMETVSPGALGIRPMWQRTLCAVFVVLGVLLIAGTSFVILAKLVFHTKQEAYIRARLIVVGLGLLFSLWLDSAIGILGHPDLVMGFRAYLLSPPSPSFMVQLLTVVLFTFGTLLFVHTCLKLIEAVEDRFAITMLVFIWTVYLTLLVLITLALLGTPDIARYNLFPVSVGCICGFGIRLAYRLLKHEPTTGAPSPDAEPVAEVPLANDQNDS